jgi:hypothetical protein
VADAKHFKVEGEGADAIVVEGEANPTREWYDYGLDTGPRLRPKRILEGEELRREMARIANAPPETTDRGAEAEAHAASEKAFRDGDDRALGKIYEDVLDEIHSPDLGERKKSDAMLERAWRELEAALTAELRELSRAERKETWGFRLYGEGLALRCQPLDGSAVLEVRVDKRALRRRIAHAASDARGSASIMVQTAREEIRQARVRLIIGGGNAVPYESEAAPS